MSHFSPLQPAPPDPILGLTAAFRADENPAKVNLSVGVYQDASGTNPVLRAVKEAERRLLESESTKGYLPIQGDSSYAESSSKLLFGDLYDGLKDRLFLAHAPGGTGALRIAGEFLGEALPEATFWLSTPTWPNHPQIFQAAGRNISSYPYLKNNGLDFEGMMDALSQAKPGDVVVLHGCCHNPSGVDPTAEQWEKVAALCVERSLMPLLDFAYQGFGNGLDEDAVGMRTLAKVCPEMVVCSSYSKNFGLYRERVGAMTVLAATEEEARTVMTRLQRVIRANYSNPPAHGAGIVSTILGDADLRSLWKGELAEMRERILAMRHALVDQLEAAGVTQDFSFIRDQRGMFSFSGLNPEQVDRLRKEFAIYIVRSGRINVAGLNDTNLPGVVAAIQAVL